MHEPPLRSQVDGIDWPPVISGMGAELLALQRQFDESQWWPPDRLRAAQFTQLRRLVAHVLAHAPFMAARLRRAGIASPDDLTEQSWRRLPILTRREVQEAGDQVRAATYPEAHGATSEVYSGGSTGVPVRVRKTAVEALLWNATMIREELWHRPDPAATLARLRSFPGSFTPEQQARVAPPRA